MEETDVILKLVWLGGSGSCAASVLASSRYRTYLCWACKL